ncbi:MAG: FAD:protein FMN transferase [Candidatus Marinimicrobia bacterium]|nr:FAD:protein FMN transferase [Candidatus Neomarinimicrobiota bacterium]
MVESDQHIINRDWLVTHGIHQFSHKAMATVFDIFIQHSDNAYASQAATEAFAQLDLLEQDLSRFVENSDISRINQLSPGESTVIGADTMGCLVIAQKLQTETKGAFNPTIGKIITHWKDETESELYEQELIGNLVLDTESFTVTLMDNPISIDLGGIGKGFALDKLLEMFNEWDIDKILLNSGKSTFLAGNAPVGESGWPMTIFHLESGKVIHQFSLENSAMAGSGIEKGNHIISPINYKPVHRMAAWSVAETGAEADALSTSFLIMEESDIRELVDNDSNVSGMVIDEKGGVLKFGVWEK